MLQIIKISYFFVLLAVGVYGVLSKILFDNIYLTSKLIVDEEFHLPLGEQYCHFKFDKWDPKVTTLPGLYLISSMILGPLGLCSIYWLRMVSLLFSCINIILLYILFSQQIKGEWEKILSALTVTLLPPLYFLSHVYYTETVSITTNLLVVILSELGHHYFASIAGFFSILCRQTNIVFIGIYGAKYILTELYAEWIQKEDIVRKDGALPSKRLGTFLTSLLVNPVPLLRKMPLQFWLNSSSYLSNFIFFVSFILYNGSIVVGDREAHQVSLNIPQLFYFSLFCLIFGWPHFVGEFLAFLHFAKRHKILISFCVLIAALVIYHNTVVHPYLLADNRHFIFYVWNRFYAKYFWFRYAMIPVYVFSLYVIVKLAWNKTDVSFFLIYIPAITLLLVTQTLLDLRYFLMPYILLRIRFQNKESAVFNVVLEFVTYCVMNMICFNIFFTKTVSIYWSDFDYPQRIIW